MTADKNVRALTSEEIAELERGGSRATDWGHVHVADGFEAKAVARCTFSGDVTLGVLALTIELGNFMTFPGTETQFAVLVNARKGQNRGVILEHPLFAQPVRLVRLKARCRNVPQTHLRLLR